MIFTFKIGRKIKEAWVFYKKYLWMFLLLTLVSLVVSSYSKEEFSIFNLIVFLVSILVSYIWMNSLIKFINGGEFTPFSKKSLPSFKKYLNFLITVILLALIIFTGLLIFIIPGIYLIGRLAFSLALVVDKNQKPIDAIKNSWRETDGFGWLLFWKSFVIGIFSVFGFLLFFFGFFVTYPIANIVFIMLYKEFFNFKLGFNSQDGIKEAEVVEEK